MLQWADSVVFITGAASGIGADCARKLAPKGVVGLGLGDVDLAGLGKVSEMLRAEHPDVVALVFHLDVTDETSVARAVQETATRFAKIDMAINAAGVGDVNKPTHEVSVDDWRRIMNINQTGTWICERHIIRQMLRQESHGPRIGRGVIVNVASALGLNASITGLPCPSYTAAKHAVVGFTKMDAKFYASHGIRINTVCPGWVETPMTRAGMDAGLFNAEIEGTPAKRAAQVNEITEPILFLLSSASSFVYGTALVVDGGYSL